jgi:broad specificity phosphatase PhoE
MTQFYVVRTGETTWEKESRIESLTGAPLSEAGVEAARRVGLELVPHEPTVVYASAGEAEQETAALIAAELGVKVRTDKRLCEIDYGLWQGLTVEEIKRRQPSLYKQWIESPGSARPPSGETLDEAGQRVVGALKDILKRHRKESPVLVLRPIVLGQLRCRMEGVGMEKFWQQVNDGLAWAGYDIDPAEL